jgi:hypothetical protein
MARVEIKITIWESYDVDSPEQLQEIIEKFKTGEIRTGEDLSEDYNLSMDYIDDTTSDMTVEENGGQSTIEVRDDEGKVIWSNGVY